MPRKRRSAHKWILSITFTSTRKIKAKERSAMFKRFKSLLERDRKSLSIEDIICEKRKIALDCSEFGSIVCFEKPVTFSIVSEEVEKNKKRMNDMTNKLINYLNTILGEMAKGTAINSTYSKTSSERGGTNIVRKFLDEAKLAKANELTKTSLEPQGIVLGFTSKKHTNVLINFYSKERGAMVGVMTKTSHKEILPWNILSEEYKNLQEILDIIESLHQERF